MSKHREKDLWKELDKLAFLASTLAIIILTIAYFFIAGVGTGEAQLLNVAQMFMLNVIANLIPVFLLFVGSYAVFRRIQTLKTERDTENLSDEIAEKVSARVLQSLFELASRNTTTVAQPEQKELSTEEKFSRMVSREFEITNKYFEESSTPQKIIVEFTNRGYNVIYIEKIKYSDTGLGLPESALLASYRKEGGGRYTIIPFDKGNAEVLPGMSFRIELCLAQKWTGDTINKWSGKWGYLKPDVVYNGKSIELFYSF